MSDTHLDGNALGGLLIDLFGREMTDQVGCCDSCGSVSALGHTIVFRGPGDVVRCANCGTVLMVVIAMHGTHRVSMGALRWIEL